ncbi:acyl transferase/acyl hydrolase/lysophospholipase [Lophiotrema nucula]|uniref:Acyl transferase/acyl hydrolase/lysophospholipase n=1 Tax=Lophiotrema nucula TaxID=690887 RepID=A0A6A5YSZ5_9PLEO|nr:acyl transferase/acyl hydrolase/lysophospholipase [Lophiotrema nucula]
MSFFYDTVLPGSTRLHGKGGVEKDGSRALRKSKSHATLLSPLIHLVRDPVGTISGAVGALGQHAEGNIALDSERDRKQVLHLRLKNAETYEDWRTTAIELDALEGNDAWKNEDVSDEYDYELIAARLKDLDDARLNCDVKRMEFLLRTTLTRGLGGMGDLRLYKHRHIGTKSLIERYIDSVQRTLEALLEVSGAQGDKCPIKAGRLTESLLQTRQSFGRSALLLSGGGTFGMNHIGVVKSLWQARLLPRIISGASAGSIVCAVLCTKTDNEIPDVLEEFCYGDLAVFEKEGEEDSVMAKAARFLKFGSLFDISHLVRVMRNLLGDITFQESYNRTRRILNITVSSASLYELPRLLNYVTAPNVMIWSAVCASCSVPFIFSAASLLAKDMRTGKEVPWDPTPNSGFIDGSVDNDLPMTRLAEMFNVNHFIVSQVNPHVVPFLAREEEIMSAEAQHSSAFAAGPSWIHNMANLAKGEALHRLHVLSEMGIFPNYLTKVRSVLNQRYSGDITILPSISYAHFPRVLSNPTTEYMLQCMITGERATWPKLSRVQNHVAIELAIDDTIQKFRTRAVFSPSQVDLRLNNLNRPVSQGQEHTSQSNTLKKSTRFERTISTQSRSSFPSRVHGPRVNVRPPQPTHVHRPYLPSSHPLRRSSLTPLGTHPSVSALEALSSSTNADDSGDFSEKESLVDSDTSDYFSPSPPYSPPMSAMPDLWPTTRQLFPWASQPNTPSLSTSRFGHRSSSLLDLAMTSSVPSSPEIRYKRLFHPPPGAGPAVLDDTYIDPQTQREVEETIQPQGGLDTGFTFPSLQQTETLPENQRVPPPTGLHQTDSFPETNVRKFNAALDIPSPVMSPSVDGSKETPSLRTPPRKLQKTDRRLTNESEREGRRSRRGSITSPIKFDISGTRGMMLRRKRSGKGSKGTD